MSAELRIKAFELAGKFLGDDENVIDFAEEIYKFISADEPNIIIDGGCCPTEEPPLEDRVFTGTEALKMCLEDNSLVFIDDEGILSLVGDGNVIVSDGVASGYAFRNIGSYRLYKGDKCK